MWVFSLLFFNSFFFAEGKERKDYLYSAFVLRMISKRSGMDHTVLPANTPCLPFLRNIHQMSSFPTAVTVTVCVVVFICKLFSISSAFLCHTLMCFCYVSATNSIMSRTCKNNNQRVCIWLLAGCSTGSCMCKWGTWTVISQKFLKRKLLN